MNAIILAAGRGSRLGALTTRRPKCLVPVLGSSILTHAIASLRAVGIDEITVVRGYRGNLIRTPGVTYVSVDAQHNMVYSLMCAATHFGDGDILVAYGDILFEPRLIRDLTSASSDIGIVLDRAWQRYFEMRAAPDPATAIAESCRLEEGLVVDIGRPLAEGELPDAQFIGLLRFSGGGLQHLRSMYDELSSVPHVPWRHSSSFLDAYMTDALQELIDRGQDVVPVLVNGGWLEIDSPQDISVANCIVERKLTDIFDYDAIDGHD